jgi:hypothetical protein
MEQRWRHDGGCNVSSRDTSLSADLTYLISHSRLTVDKLKENVSLYQGNTFSAAQRSGAEHLLFSALLYRTPSPALSLSSPHTPHLFSRSNATPAQPAHVPSPMADLQFMTPLAMGDDDEGTPEYLTITDQWCT